MIIDGKFHTMLLLFVSRLCDQSICISALSGITVEMFGALVIDTSHNDKEVESD